jgi:hypothetical protein
MRLYLAGPMRGKPLYNFPTFHAAAAHLRRQGHEVWSPAERDVKEDGFNPLTDQAKSLQYYMEHDLPALLQQEGVAVLNGWSQSAGSNIEVFVAWAVGMPVYEAWTLQYLPPWSVDLTLAPKRYLAQHGLPHLERYATT